MIERQLAVIHYKNHLLSAAFQGNELSDILVEPVETEQTIAIGDIYLAKVKNVVPNIQAAFLEVTKNNMCYLPLKKHEFSEVMQGMEIPVQIIKPAVKSKQAVCSRKLELVGMYAVVTTDITTKNISKKITDQTQRERLKKLLEEFGNEEFGLIVRTTAQNVEDDVIRKECRHLLEKMRTLLDKAKHRVCFSKLYGAERELIRYIKANGNHFFDRIITDQKEIFDELQNDLQLREENICFYEDSYPLDKLLGISSQIEKCQRKHVWLKSGGSLVIEPTEALTVIDVNTQKAIQGKRNKEHTFFKLNREAAAEAVRQIRLRNLSGIILIDFIDMEEKEHIEELMSILEQETKKDHIPTKVIDMTALGLVEITRKKARKPLYEFFGREKEEKYEAKN